LPAKSLWLAIKSLQKNNNIFAIEKPQNPWFCGFSFLNGLKYQVVFIVTLPFNPDSK
jgi:hypothetical protein